MRLSILVLIITISLLSGCLYEKEKALTPQLLDVHQLEERKTYPIPRKKTYHTWWSRFNDPQLSRLIALGLKNSPDLATAQNKVRRANAMIDSASATLWPTVDLLGYAQRERFAKFGIVPPPFNNRVFNIYDLGLNFNYEFDFWGKNRALVAAAANEACALKAEFAMTKLVLATAIAKVYFELQGTRTLLQLEKTIYKNQKALLAIITSRSQHGIASEIPVNTALLSAKQTQIKIKQYEKSAAILYNQLVILLGKNPFKVNIQISPFEFKFYHFQLPRYLALNLLGNRPDIVASLYQIESASQNIKSAKALFFPNINLMGLFSYQSIYFQKLFQPYSQNNYIGGAFDLPLFDAGKRFANLNVQYANYALAVSSYNKTILQALKEVRDEVVTLKSVSSQLNTNRELIKVIAKNERLTHLNFKHGIIDYERLLLIHNDLLAAKQSRINLQTQYLMSRVQLYKALGGYE